MIRNVTLPKLIAPVLVLLAGLFALGWLTRQDPDQQPWLRIAGGGFLLNYRIAEASYGFTAFVVRPIPTGTILEARFEDPSGGEDLIVRRRVGTETARYGFQSPAVRGVKAHHPYRVEVRVLERESAAPLWAHSFTIASQLGDEFLPRQALTVGPGYMRNLAP